MPLKAIVAVHGIGDQTQYATAKNVVSQFSAYHRVGMDIPLGRFHGSARGPIIEMVCPPDPDAMAGLAFAEVYWPEYRVKLSTRGFSSRKRKPGAGRSRTVSPSGPPRQTIRCLGASAAG